MKMWSLLRFFFIQHLASSGAIQGDEDTWLQRLMDEAKSSGDEKDEEGSETDKEKDGSEDEFNPFTCDFTRGMIKLVLDLWK